MTKPKEGFFVEPRYISRDIFIKPAKRAGRQKLKPNLFLIKIAIFLVLILGGFFIAKSVKAEDIIWDNSEVRVINGKFIIDGWDKLIIKPGTVIKLAEESGIIARGDIIAIGDALSPIVFTSIKDDSVGGDTNQDGDATSPAMGDWGIFLIRGEGTRITFDYVEIHYAGGSETNGIKSPTSFISVSSYGESQIELKEINITHSSIINNFGNISFHGEAIFKISESNFYNDADCPLPEPEGWDPRWLRCDKLGLSKGGNIIIEAPYVYWGHAEGPTTLEDYYNRIRKGSSAYFNINYEPYLIEPWPSDATGPIEPDEPDPVIIVPGIMGSWKKHGEWVIDPVLHTYDNLIEAMRQSGYEIDENLFLFPYNWRNDNVLTAGLLKEKIDEVKAQTGSEKVDIVAHSMGGLISRFYVQGSEYENDVDQLIFLNTPHQGSPESYLPHEGVYFSGGLGWLKKYAFQIEAVEHGYLSLVKYIREQVISTEQLLPVYDYLQVQVNNEWQNRMYPVQYPRNIFLENLNVVPAIEALKQRADITNIISSSGATSTLIAIRVIPDPDIYDNKWMYGYPSDIENGDLSGLINGNGDGTVPYNSLDFLDGVNIVEMIDAEHREITTKAQKDVIEILTGARPEDYFEGPWSAIKRVLFIRVYSPVDFRVIAPDGRAVGKNFASSTEINEIPGAFYSGFDAEAEFVTIINPDDGDYRVELIGTDNGTYELGIDILEDGDIESKENLFLGIISIGDKEEFNFSYEENEITVQKEISIEDLEKDLDELYGVGEIKEKQTYNYLKAKLRKLEEIYGKIEKEDKNNKKRINEFIKESYKIIEKLKFYLEKNWIMQTVYSILENNIINLINNLN